MTTGAAIAAWGLGLVFTAASHAGVAQPGAVALDPAPGPPICIARSNLPTPRAGTLLAIGIAAGLRRRRRPRTADQTPNLAPLTYRPLAA